MGQETSAPIHQRGSQLQLPNFDADYPKRPSITAELERPEPYDNVKTNVPEHELERLSTRVLAPLRTETQKKKRTPVVYCRHPEQLQKDAELFIKPLPTIQMKAKRNVKKWQVVVNESAEGKDKHGFNGKSASTDRILTIERNRLAIMGRVDHQM